MKNASETYGVAVLGGGLHTVRVVNDGARSQVTGFLAPEDEINGDTIESGRLIFGVDMSLAVVKKILIKKSPSADPALLARFEMARSLLDPPDSFYYDIMPLNGRDGYRRFLSIAYHRDEIDRLTESYARRLRKPSGFKLYAAALADGYHAFCRKEPGDLQVLIDIEADSVTLAVTYKDRLYAARNLECIPGEDITAQTARKLAAEFKMMLSFDLTELFQDGITVPLSRITVTGRHARNEAIMTALTERFTTRIARPHFEDGYFQPASNTIRRYHPERFLIPLGLALA